MNVPSFVATPCVGTGGEARGVRPGIGECLKVGSGVGVGTVVEVGDSVSADRGAGDGVGIVRIKVGVGDSFWHPTDIMNTSAVTIGKYRIVLISISKFPIWQYIREASLVHRLRQDLADRPGDLLSESGQWYLGASNTCIARCGGAAKLSSL